MKRVSILIRLAEMLLALGLAVIKASIEYHKMILGVLKEGSEKERKLDV